MGPCSWGAEGPFYRLNGRISPNLSRTFTPMNIRLIGLLMLGLLLTKPGMGQSIPQGADGIDLHTKTADSVLFRSVQGFLETQEFVIEDADETALSLETELKDEPNNVRIRVLVTVEEGTAHFQAEGIGKPGDTDTDELFTYEGDRKAGFAVLSRLVDQFAKSFDRATIEYLTP